MAQGLARADTPFAPLHGLEMIKAVIRQLTIEICIEDNMQSEHFRTSLRFPQRAAEQTSSSGRVKRFLGGSIFSNATEPTKIDPCWLFAISFVSRPSHKFTASYAAAPAVRPSCLGQLANRPRFRSVSR